MVFVFFYVQEHPKAQSAVVLVLKRLRRRGHGLKSHDTLYTYIDGLHVLILHFFLDLDVIPKRCLKTSILKILLYD